MKRPHAAEPPLNPVGKALAGLEIAVKEPGHVVARKLLEGKLQALASHAKRKRLERDASRTPLGSSGEVCKNVIVNGVVKWSPVDKTAALVVSKAKDPFAMED